MLRLTVHARAHTRGAEKGDCKLCHPAWATKRNPDRALGKASFTDLSWQCECRKISLQEEAPSSFCPNTDLTYTLVLKQAQQARQNSSQPLTERC